MFRNGKQPVTGVSIFGFKLNLFGKSRTRKTATDEAHEEIEIKPLVQRPQRPQKPQTQPLASKQRLFDNSDITKDTFVWKGEIMQEQGLKLYVLASQEHKNVYKLIHEEEFYKYAEEQIKAKSGLPSPR